MTLSIFKLTEGHANWIAQRRELIAANIANVDRPGFRSLDVQSFTHALEAGGATLVTTTSLHQQFEPGGQSVDVEPEDTGHVSHSGNTVELEHEMLKAGETARDHVVNVAIVRSFHRMFMSSVKG